MSQFSFLEAEFGDQFALATKVEHYALADPGVAVIYARKAVEMAVKWMYDHDRSLRRPYEDNLNAYLAEPAFKALANGNVHTLADKIRRAGNRAAHEAKPPAKLEAVEIVSALFKFCHWFALTYATTKPDPRIRFDPQALPRPGAEEKASLKERQELEDRLEREAEEAEAARQALAAANQTIEELEAAHAALVAEVAAAKAAAEAIPADQLDWSEAETRYYKIDGLLAEAGWTDLGDVDKEFEVVGMPSNSGVGYADYVLWGDDHLPLAVVEAKKTMVSPQTGQHQAQLYADCLEKMTGQRPVILFTNGYEHWLWDDRRYPPRPVQGFLTKDELALTIARRTSAVPLASLDIDDQIVERYYQHRAIRAIAEHVEVDKQRKALLVMATGAGKTRTVIALTDLLMRANLLKRVLFLADRTALVKQAVNAFKAHLPDSAPVNLVTEGSEDGRVYVSTYQTMVNKIDEVRPDGTRRFGVGHFDLVVIDEAHRSVYRKYRGIFEYFDSLLVGLTATPRDEVDKNTYDLFGLETGVPTDAYELADAIDDGFLVPPRAVSVATKFLRGGIRYDQLSEDERAAWEDFDWGEDEEGNPLDPPEEVSSAELNKFLFNEDTVDKVLERLMTDGVKVAAGDRLGKTIIFAKNQKHADFIYERFIANYPHLDNGDFARVITHSVNYAGDLIDKFSIKDGSPHIAISVDMLDTGIDVPECVNLVFFKLVRSKTKFWQMLGRGTRLCPELFGPGDGSGSTDKTHFNVFDFCENLKYFSQEMVPAEGAATEPLGERIFKARLELLRTFEEMGGYDDERGSVAGVLHEAVSSMNRDNFLVRPHLELVERFSSSSAWADASVGDLAALADRVAGLPDQLPADGEEAKRFDMLLMNAQLGVLRGEPFERERRKVMAIAGALEDQQTIPVVAAQLELLLDVQTDEWWTNVTYSMLEEVRKKVRSLVHLIERSKKGVIYADFEDVIGDSTEIVLPGVGGGVAGGEFAQFRKKAEHFLKEHLGDGVVAKVRSGAPLSAADHSELQRLLVAAGVGDDASFAEASARAGSFGRFIRGLVGLDRAAAKAAFDEFLDEKRYSKNQIEFVNLIINELTDRGVVEAGRVYETPYDGVAPQGPEAMFVEADVEKLFGTLKRFEESAG